MCQCQFDANGNGTLCEECGVAWVVVQCALLPEQADQAHQPTHASASERHGILSAIRLWKDELEVAKR